MRYFRKVIKIRAVDSPNVKFAEAQIRAGLEPTNEIIVPGVMPWADYCKRRALWDQIRQCIGLDAEFYEGKEHLLFPPEWLNKAERIAEELRGKSRKAKAIGIDPAEGGDKTSMSAVDELGLIEQTSKRTPDTNIIPAEAIAFGRKHGVSAENWIFDRGGGGKEHADRLRAQGYQVRTVAFGAQVTLDPKRGLRKLEERMDALEDKYAYVNRRAEMYGELSILLEKGYGLPAEYVELRRQLAPIPKLYDPEGRIFMLPKNKKENSEVKCLIDLLGCSPDEADSLVLAVWGMQHRGQRAVAGAIR